jgi:phage N-6-adenine-methyltransferase
VRAKQPRRSHSAAIRDLVDDRYTPPSLFTQRDRLYRFTVDVAASALNAKCRRYYTRETDGLLRSWGNERVWCNPPFSKLDPWLAKAWSEMRGEHGDPAQLVDMLIPNDRCEQPFWHEYVEPFRDHRGPVDGIHLTTDFIRGRSTFSAFREGRLVKVPRPPFGIVMLTWTRVR